MSDGHTMSVRFPTKKLAAELKRIARESDRSVNYVIVKACEEFVEREAEKARKR